MLSAPTTPSGRPASHYQYHKETSLQTQFKPLKTLVCPTRTAAWSNVCLTAYSYFALPFQLATHSNAKHYARIASCLAADRFLPWLPSQSHSLGRLRKSGLISSLYSGGTQTPSPPDHSNIANVKGYTPIRDKPQSFIGPQRLSSGFVGISSS
jgi:hypothetical protein